MIERIRAGLRRLRRPPAEPGVVAYSLTRGRGFVDVTVTEGALKGRTARLIPTAPSAAYFNLPKGL